MNISPVSYIRIDKNVPKFELLNFFLNKTSIPVKNFINSRLNYSNPNKPVFIIKQKVGQPSNIEFELAFYRSDPNRPYMNNILLSNTFFTKKEIEKVDSNITKSKLYDYNDFVACYAKINEETISRGSNNVNFLYTSKGNSNLQFPFFIVQDNLKGDIKHTDKFARLDDIIDKSKYHLYYLDGIIDKEFMLFFASKPLDKTEAIIIEDLSFDNFLKFLNLCKYPRDFINFCKINYNSSYIFCVSYEIDISREIVSSSIYGILA